MFWDRKKKPRIHLIGIGGSGMSGIAEVLLASGFTVTGSDLKATSITDRLQSLGATIFYGHKKENISDVRCVVVSTAVDTQNPEWVEASHRGIPVIQRAEMLAELMRLKEGIAVAGSHGKTTTTSFVGQMLSSLDPTVVVGGVLQHWKASSIKGKGHLFVIEADESDRSFLKFSQVHSIVTNIDWEHVDTYPSLEDLEDIFVEFLNRSAFYGQNWLCIDCPSVKKIRHRITKSVKTYGFSTEADLQIVNAELNSFGSKFSLLKNGKEWASFEIPVVGKHNILNTTAALGIGDALQVGLGTLQAQAKNLKLAERRLQVHADGALTAVVEDYAHHPTEIEKALEGVRLLFPNRKVRVVFQPHRYTRTKALWPSFVKVLNQLADELYLFPVYAAHEKAVEGLDVSSLAKTIKVPTKFYESIPSTDEMVAELTQHSSTPEVIVILGAAPLTALAQALAKQREPAKLASS